MWKRAQVTPVPETKQPSMYKHFRPISLLYHLGKLAEQALVNKLKAPLKDAIASNQYAYRPKVGSTDALLQLLDDCTAELDLIESKYVQLACLDFSKAFDKLQPQILLKKLQKCNINGNLIDILEDFLKRRQQCVKVNDSFSDFIDISVGAPQGTKLGPILWLFYIDDLELDNFSMVKYADDTSFYTTIRNPQTESIAPAVISTESWSDRNFKR